MHRGIRVLAASALILPGLLSMTTTASAATSNSHSHTAPHASPSSKEGLLRGSGTAITAVNAALSKQGSPYAWGAKGPSKFDCSGLVQYAYQRAGIHLPSGTKAQRSAGKAVSQSRLKPGDVIFFYRSASHVGIYVGGDKVVHAPTEGQVVKVENYKSIGPVNTIRRFQR